MIRLTELAAMAAVHEHGVQQDAEGREEDSRTEGGGSIPVTCFVKIKPRRKALDRQLPTAYSVEVRVADHVKGRSVWRTFDDFARPGFLPGRRSLNFPTGPSENVTCPTTSRPIKAPETAHAERRTLQW